MIFWFYMMKTVYPNIIHDGGWPMNKPSLTKTWAIVSLVAALALSSGTVDSSWARGGWGGMNANLTPEQAGQVFDLRQKFFNDTAGLRDK
jgi:hypothetical protein